jgi:hypothetical protein
MRLRWKLMVVASALAGTAAAAYGELVLDISAPRASLVQIQAIASTILIQTADLHASFDAIKKKYGPDSETVLMTKPPRLVTRVSGKVVEEDGKVPKQFGDAWGLFVIGPPDRLESTFPFRINPREASPPGRKEVVPDAGSLRNQFGRKFPGKYLEFDKRDVVTDRCITISPADLGWIGKQLRFQSGTFCVEFWRGASPGSMLIGVAMANGDPWMRPFSRRICRWLTGTALARLATTDREPPPDYAACVLVDRPDRSGTDATLEAHVYEVRRDASLAYVLPPSK